MFGLPLVLMASGPAVYQPQANEVTHMFRLVPPRAVRTVNLAGTFNGWDKGATPMTQDGDAWTVSVKLKPGRYEYKFVLDGEDWITDPKGANVSDGNGHMNSVLMLVPYDYTKAASPNDGVIATSALEHRTEVPYFNFDRGQLTLTSRERPNDAASTVLVVKGKGSFPMAGTALDEMYRQYKVSIPWDRKSDLSYHFELKDGGKTFTYGPAGLNDTDDFKVTATTYHPFTVPDWVEKGVIYQIFPDRFDNGDKSNDPKNVAPWNSAPTYNNHYGGDVAGIRKHVGYLQDLGISTLYLNPIFRSNSNHRYDTIDYLKVDPEIGTNEEFGALTRDLKQHHIRTVLDGVFNHTATQFFAFDDVVKKGEASKYTYWYTFKGFPVKVEENPNYVAWYNYPSMPKINHANLETRAYLLNVPKYWSQHADIAGWRLDVANEVPMDYWRDFRRTVKGIDPNMWIMGEEWGDAGRWLTGDQWDSVMDYPFRGAVLAFVGTDGNGKPSELLKSLNGVYGMYAPQVSRNAMNLLSSHDTPRIRTLCGGDADLAKLAAAIQFTWAGTPSIYYGDELGMEGDKDPDNRRCMDWAHANAGNDFLNYYRKLIAIRNANPVLQSGDPITLKANDEAGTACYARLLDGKIAYVALNRSSVTRETAIPRVEGVGTTISFVDVLGGQPVRVDADGTLIVKVAPKSAAILIPRSGTAGASPKAIHLAK